VAVAPRGAGIGKGKAGGGGCKAGGCCDDGVDGGYGDEWDESDEKSMMLEQVLQEMMDTLWLSREQRRLERIATIDVAE
jgi:hypothetical protein